MTHPDLTIRPQDADDDAPWTATTATSATGATAVDRVDAHGHGAATPRTPPRTPTAVNSFDSRTGMGELELESEKRKAAREPQPLPEGCSYGTLPREDGSEEKVIWVEFATGSRENPFYFSRGRKLAITIVATLFTFMTGKHEDLLGLTAAYTTSAYSISAKSMCKDLGCDTLEIEAGIALYCWGFGMAPLVLAPVSEELGRKWTYIAAVIAFFLLQLMMTL